MLQPPKHQVAGHQASEVQLGPLVDSSGRFYKPLQGNERGDREAAFYASFSTDPRVPPHMRRFFPGFHGTLLLPASDGRGPYPHLVLDDLLAPYDAAPSVVDLKIGARTWAPTTPDDYLHKCLNKDRESTSLSLGFRVSGIQIHQGSGSGCYRPDRGLLKSFGTADVKRILRQFVSSNPVSDPIPDCTLASLVYGGSEGILAQLLELKAWFEDQTLFHFFAASILIVYDRDGAGKGNGRPMVRLVDFAHVVEGNGVIDHNFLGGLCSLIKFISEILTGPKEEEKEASKQCLENGG